MFDMLLRTKIWPKYLYEYMKLFDTCLLWTICSILSSYTVVITAASIFFRKLLVRWVAFRMGRVFPCYHCPLNSVKILSKSNDKSDFCVKCCSTVSSGLANSIIAGKDPSKLKYWGAFEVSMMTYTPCALVSDCTRPVHQWGQLKKG